MPVKSTSQRYVRETVRSLLSKDGTIRTNSSTFNSFSVTNSVTTDPNLPNWKWLIANGHNATTTMSGSETRVSGRPTYAIGTVIEYGATLPPNSYPYTRLIYDSGEQSNPSGAQWSSAELAKVDNQAKMKFISQIRKLQTSMTGGVFLGELRETLRALKRPAQSLRGGLDHYFDSLKKRRRGVRGSPAHRRETLREIAGNTWLEYSFGWKPLVNDIDDAAKTLADHLHGSRLPISKMVRGSAKNYVDVPAYGLDGNVTDGALTVHRRRTGGCEYHVKYYGKVAIKHPTKITAQRVGLSLDHFVPTAWELVPWSFLVDYFTNIGEILEAASTCLSDLKWTTKSTLEIERAVWTDISTSSTKVLQGGVFVDALRHRFVTPGVSVTERRRITRSPYAGSLIPGLEFQIPGFGTKWINLAALGATHRRLRPYY